MYYFLFFLQTSLYSCLAMESSISKPLYGYLCKPFPGELTLDVFKIVFFSD